MTHDLARGRVVLFGGRGADGLLEDTWSLAAGTWTQLTPATHPSARANHVMATVAGEVVLTGGATLVPETWLLAVALP